MKKYILIAFTIFCGSMALAGTTNDSNEKSSTKLVSGKVIDKVSGEEIPGAEIKIADKTFYSDLNGNFSILLPIAKQTALVKFISYADTEISIDPVSYAPVVIELSGQ